MTESDAVNESNIKLQEDDGNHINMEETINQEMNMDIVSADNSGTDTEKTKVPEGVSLMENYVKNARKFTIIGIAGVMIGLLCAMIIRKQNDPLMIISAIVMFGGALIAVTGISSLRPEGMLRTFVQLASMQPTTSAMRDLKVAIERCKMAAVRKQLKIQLESTVAKYENMEGADLELADEVRRAGQKLRIKRII